MSKICRAIGRIHPDNTCMFLCDIQEIFRAKIYQMPTVTNGASTLLDASKELEIPVIATTQCADKFGRTVVELDEKLGQMKYQAAIFDKSTFSMLTSDVLNHISNMTKRPTSVIICGLEAHVCVLQTCLDLIHAGFEVHVVADAISSTNRYKRSVALQRLRQSNAYITSVESAIFELMKDSKHPRFRAVSQLIKNYSSVAHGFNEDMQLA